MLISNTYLRQLTKKYLEIVKKLNYGGVLDYF
jgi:hypothetical protein